MSQSLGTRTSSTRGGSSVTYQRVTLIDHLFSGPNRLRFCTLVLVNWHACRILGEATSRCGESWRTAMAEWFARMDQLYPLGDGVQEYICAADSFQGCGTSLVHCLEEDGKRDRKVASIAQQMAREQRPHAKTVDYGQNADWVENLYYYADQVNGIVST